MSHPHLQIAAPTPDSLAAPPMSQCYSGVPAIGHPKDGPNNPSLNVRLTQVHRRLELNAPDFMPLGYELA
jgi:hypothetical protein